MWNSSAERKPMFHKISIDGVEVIVYNGSCGIVVNFIFDSSCIYYVV